MSKGKPVYCIFAIVSALALLLQGCVSQPSPTATPSLTPERAFAPSVSINESAYSTALVAPSPEEVTPSPTPTPTPTPKPKPKPVAYSVKGFTTHDYAASDAKKIYYFSNNGVHCMNKNGSGDQLTSILNFYYFLAFNTHGLFYVAPNSDENHGDCVMVYDPATQTTTLIKDHIVSIGPAGNYAVTLGSMIYMMDAGDYSHIMCYDMSKGTMTDVTGIPAEFKDDEFEFDIENGHVYLEDFSGDVGEYFIITGNKVKACTQPPEDTDDTDQPQETLDPDDDGIYYETGDGAQFRFDEQTETLAIWTGTEYSDLDIPNIYHITVSGKKLYVLSYEEKDNWPGDDYEDGDPIPPIKTGSPYALYSVSSDGTIKMLCKGVDKASHYSDLGEGAVYDVIGGWYFTFWETNYGDAAGITGLLLKQKMPPETASPSPVPSPTPTPPSPTPIPTDIVPSPSETASPTPAP